MAKVSPLPSVSKNDALSEIRRIAVEQTERVILVDHARARMQERDVTIRRVFQVLKEGNPVEGPKWDTTKERGWKCRLRMIVAGMEVSVVVKLVERKKGLFNLVVTVISN